MPLSPQEIKDRMQEIGISESRSLLKNWISNSNDIERRRQALDILGSIDEGKDYIFYEQLFLSDEDLEIRLIAGDI